MNDDGRVMRGPQVAAFADKHGLKQLSIADLIAYRQARDKLVERVSEFQASSEIGSLTGYAYVTPFDRVHHFAFVYGNIGDGKDVPARLHRADVIGDVLGRRQDDSRRPGALQEGRPRRHRVSARRYGRRSGHRDPARHQRHRSAPAPGNGARSDWARKSSRISASPRSACWPPASAPTWALAVSASKSHRRKIRRVSPPRPFFRRRPHGTMTAWDGAA